MNISQIGKNMSFKTIKFALKSEIFAYTNYNCKLNERKYNFPLKKLLLLIVSFVGKLSRSLVIINFYHSIESANSFIHWKSIDIPGKFGVSFHSKKTMDEMFIYLHLAVYGFPWT